MLIVLGSKDHFLSSHIGELLEELKLRKIRTVKIDRITKELKQPERLAILDVALKELQKPGVLKQLVNISRITGSRVVCICPNDDEKLKRLARSANPDECFIRYDLELGFREYLEETAKEALASGKK